MTEQAVEQEDEMIVLSFNIGDQLFGVDIFDIINITRVNLKNLYAIPKASTEVLGMYSNNRDVFPVFDLHLLLNTAGFEFPGIDSDNISVIKIKVKGFISGLGVQTEPNFQTVNRNDVSDATQTGVKSIWQTEDQVCSILDLAQLFPNVKVTQKEELNKSNEEDLDLSQYLLEE